MAQQRFVAGIALLFLTLLLGDCVYHFLYWFWATQMCTRQQLTATPGLPRPWWWDSHGCTSSGSRIMWMSTPSPRSRSNVAGARRGLWPFADGHCVTVQIHLE